MLSDATLAYAEELTPALLGVDALYRAESGDQDGLVVLNMSASEQKVQLDLSPLGFASPRLSILLTSFHKPLSGMTDALPVEPYSAFIAKVTK